LCYSPENPIESRAVVGVYQDKEPASNWRRDWNIALLLLSEGISNSINDNVGGKQKVMMRDS
jgi:hypothetical protein